MKKKKRRQEGIWLFSCSNIDGEDLEFDEIMTSTVDVKFHSLSTIIAATENFSNANKVGEGGFGSVYKVRTL